MCQSCAEHTKKVWYLEDKNHQLSKKTKDLMVTKKIVQLAEAAAQFMFYRKNDFTKIEYKVYNWFAKNIHGGQIVPHVEQSFDLIDKSKDIAATYCICVKYASGGKVEDYKCLYLNTAAEAVRKVHPDKTKFITKEEAKKLVSTKRKQGAFQSVLWGPSPKVASLCNCFHTCGAFQIPGVKSAFIPSLVQAEVIAPKKCDLCGKCFKACHFKAIKVKKSGCEINPIKCIGCGLCIEKCESGVLAFGGRKDYYDPTENKWVGPNAKRALDLLMTSDDRERMRKKNTETVSYS